MLAHRAGLDAHGRNRTGLGDAAYSTMGGGSWRKARSMPSRHKETLADHIGDRDAGTREHAVCQMCEEWKTQGNEDRRLLSLENEHIRRAVEKCLDQLKEFVTDTTFQHFKSGLQMEVRFFTAHGNDKDVTPDSPGVAVPRLMRRAPAANGQPDTDSRLLDQIAKLEDKNKHLQKCLEQVMNGTPIKTEQLVWKSDRVAKNDGYPSQLVDGVPDNQLAKGGGKGQRIEPPSSGIISPVEHAAVLRKDAESQTAHVVSEHDLGTVAASSSSQIQDAPPIIQRKKSKGSVGFAMVDSPRRKATSSNAVDELGDAFNSANLVADDNDCDVASLRVQELNDELRNIAGELNAEREKNVELQQQLRLLDTGAFDSPTSVGAAIKDMLPVGDGTSVGRSGDKSIGKLGLLASPGIARTIRSPIPKGSRSSKEGVRSSLSFLLQENESRAGSPADGRGTSASAKRSVPPALEDRCVGGGPGPGLAELLEAESTGALTPVQKVEANAKGNQGSPDRPQFQRAKTMAAMNSTGITFEKKRKTDVSFCIGAPSKPGPAMPTMPGTTDASLLGNGSSGVSASSPAVSCPKVSPFKSMMGSVSEPNFQGIGASSDLQHGLKQRVTIAGPDSSGSGIQGKHPQHRRQLL